MTTVNGITFRAGRRTAAHLAWTDDRLRENGKWLRIIQPCYNTTVTASAGTHDGDGCVDVDVQGMSWADSQTALRKLGWAAWFRPYKPNVWGDHIHMVSLGCPGPVGIYIPGQVDDYYAHRTGLIGHAPDPTWHPADIDSTIFDYPAWVIKQEDAMGYLDWSDKDRQALVNDVAQAILDAAKVDRDETVSVRQAINQIRNAVK
jgi:hypothetical protein